MPARKAIIVTGASRGIGHATALRFHREGWRVITVSRTPPPGECPWSRERSHILLDLSDLGNIVRCIEIMRGMLEGGELARDSSTTPGSRRKDRTAAGSIR